MTSPSHQCRRLGLRPWEPESIAGEHRRRASPERSLESITALISARCLPVPSLADGKGGCCLLSPPPAAEGTPTQRHATRVATGSRSRAGQCISNRGHIPLPSGQAPSPHPARLPAPALHLLPDTLPTAQISPFLVHQLVGDGVLGHKP